MYLLKPLPFHYQDLEPFIDTHTIGLHYWKHQKNYLDQLNRLLLKNNFSFSYPVEEIYQHLDAFKKEDRNNLIFYLGGVVNHDLYWQSINPNKKEVPKGKLLEAIRQKFGSFENLKRKWQEYALDLKGSGYVFLIKLSDNTVDLVTMSNQDSPLLFSYTPLFCMDMWEHAYYLNYQNKKQDYLDNFFEIANFAYANRVFEDPD